MILKELFTPSKHPYDCEYFRDDKRSAASSPLRSPRRLPPPPPPPPDSSRPRAGILGGVSLSIIEALSVIFLPLREKSLQMQTRRRAEFVHDIMFNLDILIYAELCVLYYMDCSFFRFLLRVLFQVMFLTPKPKFVPPTAKHRPYLGALIGGNVICTLLHMFTHRPEAGELTKGYLHGGIIIDFIGQKGPTSKLRLVVMDLLVTALQCFMLAVHVEETRLKEVLSAPESSVLPITTSNLSQDHDAEERGVTRDAGINSEGIELQELPQSRRRDDVQAPHDDDEQAQLLSDADGRANEEDLNGSLDLYYSSNVIVGEFHVLHTLRSQWEDYDSATTTALQTVGTSAGYHFARVNHQLRRLETLQ